jgi:guanylate kinase
MGKCVILSAPSGGGKTTIMQYLLNCNLDLEFSISACTRKKREKEIDGKDYYFLSVDEFKRKIENNEFVEWEEVYADNFYGTLKTEVERIWTNGKHVIFDVDVKGGVSLKKNFGDKALGIFIQPPSMEALEKRLRSRKTETEESLQKRLKKAEYELTYANKFDVVLINDDLNKACEEAKKIVSDFLTK